MASAEADLHARFAKLTGRSPGHPGMSSADSANLSNGESDLADRLAKLGPAKYPEPSEPPSKQDYEVQMALDYARKHKQDESAGIDDPSLSALLAKISAGASDESLAQFITGFEGGTTGASGQSSAAASSSEVAQIIQQAKDYARFKSDAQHDSDSDAGKDSLTESESSSSSESDDSDSPKKGRRKSKPRNSKQRKSGWKLF